MAKSIQREIARWTRDRSNGDPDNLMRSIRLFYSPTAQRDYKYGAVGIRQGWHGEQDWPVIASVASGRTVELAILRMLEGYWQSRKIPKMPPNAFCRAKDDHRECCLAKGHKGEHRFLPIRGHRG